MEGGVLYLGLYRRKDSQVYWMSFTVDGRMYRKSTETEDRKLAEAILGKVKTQIVEGKWFDKAVESQITFRELTERYMERYQKQRDPVSKKRLLPVFGDMLLTEIGIDDVEDYVNTRLMGGAKASTVYKEFALGRRMFNVARRKWQKEFGVTLNPFADAGFPSFNNERDRWLTVEEEEALIKAASPEWVKDIIIFAIHTGCRRGEILDINVKDNVDMVRRVITVQATKGGNRKMIPMSEKLFEMLTRRLKVVSISGRLFDIKVVTLKDGFCRAVEKAGLGDFHFHDLRHTFGTRLVQMGVDLYRVQKLMGHKSIRMTERYAHHCPDSLKSAADALDGYYFHDFFTFNKPGTCPDVKKSFKIKHGSV